MPNAGRGPAPSACCVNVAPPRSGRSPANDPPTAGFASGSGRSQTQVARASAARLHLPCTINHHQPYCTLHRTGPALPATRRRPQFPPHPSRSQPPAPPTIARPAPPALDGIWAHAPRSGGPTATHNSMPTAQPRQAWPGSPQVTAHTQVACKMWKAAPAVSPPTPQHRRRPHPLSSPPWPSPHGSSLPPHGVPPANRTRRHPKATAQPSMPPRPTPPPTPTAPFL